MSILYISLLDYFPFTSFGVLETKIYFSVFSVISILVLFTNIWQIIDLSAVHVPLLHTDIKDDTITEKKVNLSCTPIWYNTLKERIPENNREKLRSEEYMAFYDEYDVRCKFALMVFNNDKDFRIVKINVDGVRRMGYIHLNFPKGKSLVPPRYVDLFEKPLHTPTTLGIQHAASIKALTRIKGLGEGIPIEGVWTKKPVERYLNMHKIKIYSNHEPVRTDNHRKMFIFGKHN